MPVTGFEVRSRGPFGEGQSFGDAGAYEVIEGVLRFAVDPANESNAGIVDLQHAARNAQGRVEFEADVRLIRPADPSKANGRLLCDAVDAGDPTFGQLALGASQPGGDGYLLERGWTIACIGWQWDVERVDGRLGLEAPSALDADGRPIQGWAYTTYQPNALHPHFRLADEGLQPYPAADLDQPDARLLVRDFPNGTRQDVPRERWRFARIEGDQAVPDAGYVAVDGGVETGRYYEAIYRTDACPVVGAGLLAFRDAAAFFRHSTEDDNPVRGQISHVLALGIARSGRFLRDLLAAGANLDEEGRIAFDGMHIHAAGARRGEFNYRYARPATGDPYGLGAMPPFAYEETVHPFTKEPMPGLLARLRERGGVPRIVQTSTSTEYWRGDAAMTHVTPDGGRDLPDLPEVRAYHFAGTQEATGCLPLARGSAEDAPVTTANPLNVTDYTPLLRGAFANLDRWVCDGVEPPPSAIPSLAERTAVTRDRASYDVSGFSTIYQVVPRRLWNLPTLGFGPDAEDGIGAYPPVVSLTKVFPAIVPAVDTDGNEVGGVRLPDIAVPIATHTGWNPRDNALGGLDETYGQAGSTVPFAMTAAEREQTADPRPSIEERYGGRDDYLARVHDAALGLLDAGYVLPDDVATVEANAIARWDALVEAPA